MFHCGHALRTLRGSAVRVYRALSRLGRQAASSCYQNTPVDDSAAETVNPASTIRCTVSPQTCLHALTTRDQVLVQDPVQRKRLMSFTLKARGPSGSHSTISEFPPSASVNPPQARTTSARTDEARCVPLYCEWGQTRRYRRQAEDGAAGAAGAACCDASCTIYLRGLSVHI